MTAAAMATAAPANAPLWKVDPDAPLMKTGRVGAAELAGTILAGVDAAGAGTGVMTAGAGAGAGTTDAGADAGATVVTTTIGVAGTFSVVQGMMTVRVASMQVEEGSSHFVQGVVVVQPTVTHSVAVQVTVAVHQSQ
jgi:hypothetical protein